jgi:hypothetical protein
MGGKSDGTAAKLLKSGVVRKVQTAKSKGTERKLRTAMSRVPILKKIGNRA